MLAIIRARDNQALSGHTGTPGSDGIGNLRILCGCRNGYKPDEWLLHLRGVVTQSRQVK